MSNESLEPQIARANATERQRIALVRLVDRLRRTVQLDDDRVVMTNESAEVLAPYVEAVAALEAIIWASDGCVGHRHCAHSMEPWQRARAVLQTFWEVDERERT